MREEIKEDLRNRRVLADGESADGDSGKLNVAQYSAQELQGLKRDLDMYPQGGEKAVLLRDKF